MNLKSYKVQLMQQLKPVDHQQRRVFADWVLEMYKNDPKFHRKIIFSDEATSVSSSTSKIVASVIFEKPRHPQRVTFDVVKSLDLTFLKMRQEQQLR